MKTRTWLIIAGVSAAAGIGGSFLFHNLAEKARLQTHSERGRLEALQQQIALRDSTLRRDSMDVSIVTPDLVFFGLHGRVREMRQGETLASFDKNGRWINQQTYVTRAGYTPQFERNKFDYIIGGRTRESLDGVAAEQLTYTWTDGLLTKIESKGCESDYVIKYNYDHHNLLLGSHTVCFDEGGKSEISTSYTYRKFDRLGNWTEREARSAIKNVQYGGYYDDEKDTFVEDAEPIIESNEEIETRTISYY